MCIRTASRLALLTLGLTVASLALAQPPQSLTPAVNTSPADEPPPATAASAAVPVAQAARPAGPAADAAAPPAAARAPAPPSGLRDGAGAPQTAPAGAATPASSDRIELGTTQISGNRELPKLMYIVPWQRAAVGRISGRPPNSLVDEALAPVDRTVFERQNSYYAALQAASISAPSQPAAPGTPAAPAAPRDEK